MGDIRAWLLDISHSVKLSYYCKLVGINSSNLTVFMKGYDGSISYDKLIRLIDLIKSDLLQKIE